MLLTLLAAQPLVFAVLGDSRGKPVSPLFAKVVEMVNGSGAQFAFHTGDFFVGTDDPEEGREQVEAYLKVVAKSRIPIYPVMGNHDARPGTYRPCVERVFKGGPTYYSFDRGNCHFVVLDAYEPGHRGRLSPKQWEWLKRDLEKAKGKHIFVFIHPPLYPVDGHLKGSLPPDEAGRLSALFKEAGVDIVFCGHEHLYARLVYDGLVQVITGGAGAPLYKPLPLERLPYERSKVSSYKAEAVHHFCLVEVRGPQVRVSVLSLDGRRVDEFLLHRLAGPKGSKGPLRAERP